jgi:hypothetical protein
MADLGPVLEAPDADFGHWVTPPPKDGVLSLGWYGPGPAGEALRAAAEGSMEGAFESGLLAAICRRAAMLLESGA